MNYEILEGRTVEELEILKSDANEKLFQIQNTEDLEQINFWSEVSATCNSIIKQRQTNS